MRMNLQWYLPKIKTCKMKMLSVKWRQFSSGPNMSTIKLDALQPLMCWCNIINFHKIDIITVMNIPMYFLENITVYLLRHQK